MSSAKSGQKRQNKRPRLSEDGDETGISNTEGQHSWSQSHNYNTTNANAFDMSSFDDSTFRGNATAISPFTGLPAQHIQPWMGHWGEDEQWPDFSLSQDGLGGVGNLPPGDSLPDLTPDNSNNNSPPSMLNLPPELMNTTRSDYSNSINPLPHVTTCTWNQNHQNAFNSGTDASTAMLLDPTFNTNNTTPTNNADRDLTNLGLPPDLQPKCACVDSLYLQLHALSAMETNDPNYTFPYSLHPLRQAMKAIDGALDCQICPYKFITAIQNTQMLGTVMMTVAERFNKILSSITTEAQRAEDEDETKKFRIADLNTSTSHLHYGGVGCAAAFHIDLSPSEWRRIAKQVVKAEVYGSKEGNECCVAYIHLVEKLEGRHQYWEGKTVPNDFPVDHSTGQVLGGRGMPKEDHLCLKYAQYGRKLVDGGDWE